MTRIQKPDGWWPYLHIVVALMLAFPGVVSAAHVVLGSSQDNTLYDNGPFQVSNGVGDHFFTGETARDALRRGAIQFDIAGHVPPGATINNVTLRLYMSRTQGGNATNELHRMLAEWGEAASHAMGEEGVGVEAVAGDVTWDYRFFPDQAWGSPGGDYAPSASASTSVGGTGYYTWNSASLRMDCEAWLDDPASNFGWIVLGGESGSQTAKRFDTRENDNPARRPELTIDFTPIGGQDAGACCLPDGTCIVLEPGDCAAQAGNYQGDDTNCTTDPCQGVPVTITIEPSRDNTLFEDAGGTVSNGSGEFFFSGLGAGQILRRGLLGFDIQGSIPPGAIIADATLTLRKTFGGSAAVDVMLHRGLDDWGEGASDGAGDEEDGAPAEAGDATWIHTFYPTDTWSVPGGEFDPTPSATTYIAFEDFYSWSGPGMVADLQAWVDDPSQNFGWFVIGKETGSVLTRKRFVSRESVDTQYRPKLEITYSIPPVIPEGACCLTDAPCEVMTAASCTVAGGTYLGDGTKCSPNSCELYLEPYVDALPIPSVAVPVVGVAGEAASYEISIVEVDQKLHRDLPLTRLWTYDGVYPGPTIEASVGNPVDVTWISDIRDEQDVLRDEHYLPVDLCMHGPNHLGPTPRTVVHLHGGHIPAESDGHPEDTILPGEQQTFFYPNNQEPATLWYHDHALGITRLNVMLGLSGLYLIRDDAEDALGLPADEYEIPLVIADRSFHADGTIAYPAAWDEHFFGNKTLVNGKVWPYLEVDQGEYRFRILNGANSRTYKIGLSNGQPFTVIGGDGGLLPEPVVVDSLLLTPAERYDVIIDFSGESPGAEILVGNGAPAPYPSESEMQPQIEPVMKFVVTANAGFNATLPDTLRPMEILDEEDAVENRDFVIEKFFDECTGSVWLINGLHWGDITEYPLLGSTEVWRFINRSGMVHPMHMHLVMFQVLDSQPFEAVGDTIIATGPRVPPDPEGAGWRDTVPVLPNEMVRVIARFEDYTGLFPYHCHILEHEDYDMMRQFEVLDTTSVTVDPLAFEPEFRILPSLPNPSRGDVELRFRIPDRAQTKVEIFDVAGRRLRTLLDSDLEPGLHSVVWGRRDDRGRIIAPGVYLYRVTLPGREHISEKLLLLDTE